MSATTRTAPSAMPAGHDDKKSHWFIPADLREHYEPSFDEAAVMKLWQGNSERWTTAPAPAVFLMEYGIENPKEPMPERIRKLTRGRSLEEDSSHELQSLALKIADGATWDERCWVYHMQVLLPAARSRKASAVERVALEAARVARQTCTICGEDKPDTNRRGITATGRLLRGPNGGDTGFTVQACELCALAVHQAFIERHSAVNGRPRRELAAAWLDQHQR